jgi:hypothetical protein
MGGDQSGPDPCMDNENSKTRVINEDWSAGRIESMRWSSRNESVVESVEVKANR